MTAEEVAARVAAVLAEHVPEWRGYPQIGGLAWVCTCGELATVDPAEHRAHVAAAVAAVFGAGGGSEAAGLRAAVDALSEVERRLTEDPPTYKYAFGKGYGCGIACALDQVREVSAALAARAGGNDTSGGQAREPTPDPAEPSQQEAAR